jgi:hypothetical protein
MKSNQSCQYRNCENKLDISTHGNREYCEPDSAEPAKLSCNALEESYRKKERDKLRAIQNKAKIELRYSIQSLLDGRSEMEFTYDQIENKINPYLEYFLEINFKISGENRRIFEFEDYIMYKTLEDGRYIVSITKNTNYE